VALIRACAASHNSLGTMRRDSSVRRHHLVGSMTRTRVPGPVRTCLPYTKVPTYISRCSNSRTPLTDHLRPRGPMMFSRFSCRAMRMSPWPFAARSKMRRMIPAWASSTMSLSAAFDPTARSVF
jgi:hypothetical protein